MTGSPNGGTITTVIDLLGRTTSVTDVRDVTTTTTYDTAGRVASTASVIPSGTGRTVAYTYDADSRPLSVAAQGAVVAQATYTNGELTAVTYPTGTGNAGNGTAGTLTGACAAVGMGLDVANVTNNLMQGTEVTGTRRGKRLSRRSSSVSDTESVPARRRPTERRGSLVRGSGTSFSFRLAQKG